jgi:hypothetical protein
MLTQFYVRARVLLVIYTATQVVRTVTTNAQGRYTGPELCHDKIRISVDAHAALPELPSVQIGSDRALGRDAFGIA